ncbi:MAG: redoxin family protein [Rubripirellula sp.]
MIQHCLRHGMSPNDSTTNANKVFNVCSFMKSAIVFLTLFASTAVVHADEAEATNRPVLGKRAPDFELPVVGSDEFLSLSDEYKQGKVVVVVLRGYPGYQCPLCSSQIAALANRSKTLLKEAHRVILVYPGEANELQRHAERFMGSRSLPDPLIIVRDEGMEMVESWGLRWNASRETAYPSTFVLDGNGRVRWMKISKSHGERSSVAEILKELRKLK